MVIIIIFFNYLLTINDFTIIDLLQRKDSRGVVHWHRVNENPQSRDQYSQIVPDRLASACPRQRGAWFCYSHILTSLNESL